MTKENLKIKVRVGSPTAKPMIFNSFKSFQTWLKKETKNAEKKKRTRK